MAFGAPFVVMCSPCCVEPTVGGKCDVLPPVIRTERLYPLPGLLLRFLGLLLIATAIRLPKGIRPEAYARRLGTAQKVHFGEAGATAGGYMQSGGVRSFMEQPLLSNSRYSCLIAMSILTGLARWNTASLPP